MKTIRIIIVLGLIALTTGVLAQQVGRTLWINGHKVVINSDGTINNPSVSNPTSNVKPILEESLKSDNSNIIIGIVVVVVIVLVILAFCFLAGHFVTIGPNESAAIVDSAGNPTGRTCGPGRHWISDSVLDKEYLVKMSTDWHSLPIRRNIRTACLTGSGKSEISYNISIGIKIYWQFPDLSKNPFNIRGTLAILLGKIAKGSSPSNAMSVYAQEVLDQVLVRYKKLSWRYFVQKEIIDSDIELPSNVQTSLRDIRLIIRITDVNLPKELTKALETEAHGRLKVSIAQTQAVTEVDLHDVAEKTRLRKTQITASVRETLAVVERKAALAEIATQGITGLARAIADGEVNFAKITAETKAAIVQLEQMRRKGIIDAESYALMQQAITPQGVQLEFARGLSSLASHNPQAADKIITVFLRSQAQDSSDEQTVKALIDAVQTQSENAETQVA